MSITTYGTLTGSNYGFTISPDRGDSAPKPPSGLIVTQAVQTKDGWLGQVIVDRQIVWEGDLSEDGEAAIKSANGGSSRRSRRCSVSPRQRPRSLLGARSGAGASRQFVRSPATKTESSRWN